MVLKTLKRMIGHITGSHHSSKHRQRMGAVHEPAIKLTAPVTNRCQTCPALCCNYIALEIDVPEDRADYDYIRWYLAHKNVHVYVDEGEWHVQFFTPCEHLVNNRCSIYNTRYNICRSYSDENCDASDLQGPDNTFRTVEEFDVWFKENVDETLAKQEAKEKAKRAKKYKKNKKKSKQ